MEVIKRYPQIDDLISSLTRIANNLDTLTEIMTTTSVKVTQEKAKQINTLYGMSAARPLPDYDPEILWKEIQDLKLENDRLKQRDAIMLSFIKSIDCTDRSCVPCVKMGDNGVCKWTLFQYRVEMVNDVLKKLEEL